MVTSTGLVTALAAGSVTITAQSEGVTATTTFSVVDAPRGLVMLSGDRQVAQSGAEYPIVLEVFLRDSLGRPASNVAVRFQGVGAGAGETGGWPPRTKDSGRAWVRWWAPTDGTKQFTVVARVEGATGFQPNEVVFTLFVSDGLLYIGPDTVLTAGDSVSTRATLDGVRQANIAWVSSDPGVVTVSGTGMLSARNEGIATITGSVATRTGVLRATRTVRVRKPLSSAAAARMFPASAFDAGTLSINLPASPSGTSYLVIVPALSTLDWHRNQAGGSARTQVSVAQSTDGIATPGRDLRWGTTPIKRVWPSPRSAPLVGLAVRREFSILTPSQGRVPVIGRLAYTGTDYAFYEDTTNTVNFTASQYRRMDDLLAAPTRDLFDLMGAPTDLDGNGKIIVLMSRTVLNNAGAGTAFSYACDLDLGNPDCPTAGEIVYFGTPEGFWDWSSAPTNYTDSWYPRNILHESVHVLQGTHAWRSLSRFQSLRAPGHLTEGLAEFTRMRSRMGFTDAWNYASAQYASRDFSKTPYTDVYYSAAIFNWWMGRKFGDGYPQSLIGAMYSALPSQRDILEDAVGVAEPELLTMFYASLYFDESLFGGKFGLEFPGENVPLLLNYTLPATEEMVPGLTLVRNLQYTQGRIFRITHSAPVRVTIQAAGAGAAVLVAQP